MSPTEEGRYVKVVKDRFTVKVGDQTFKSWPESIRFQVRDLYPARSSASSSVDAGLRGSAIISDESSLSVIGADRFNTSTVDLSICAVGDDQLAAHFERTAKKLEEDFPHKGYRVIEPSGAGWATIYFFGGGWDDPDTWTLAVEVPQGTFSDLVESVSTGRLRNLEIRVQAQDDLYGSPRGWCLRPKDSDGDVTFPEPAGGIVTHLNWMEAGWNSQAETEEKTREREAEARRLASATKLFKTLQNISSNITRAADETKALGTLFVRHRKESETMERGADARRAAHEQQVLSTLQKISRNLLWVAAAIGLTAVLMLFIVMAR